MKPGEVKVDKSTGMVTRQRGVSLNTDAGKMSKYGGAYQIDSLPDGLQVKQVGSDPGHYEIVPEYPMSQADFQSKLNQIKTSPVK